MCARLRAQQCERLTSRAVSVPCTTRRPASVVSHERAAWACGGRRRTLLSAEQLCVRDVYESEVCTATPHSVVRESSPFSSTSKLLPVLTNAEGTDESMSDAMQLRCRAHEAHPRRTCDCGRRSTW